MTVVRRNTDTLVKTLPAVAVAVVAKLACNALGWDVIEINALYSSLVAANVFLLGFLLAGVLTDYKESEKLPTEVAVRVETICDECEILYADKQSADAHGLFGQLEQISEQIHQWLKNGGRVEQVLDQIREMNDYFRRFESQTQPNFIVRLKQEQSLLRQAVLRIDTIRETSFVGAGYLVAVMTSFLVVLALVLTDFAAIGVELFLIGTIAFLLSYMIFLIRDLDNPFDYRAGHETAAEVSLQPLRKLHERLIARRSVFDQ